MLNTGAMNNLIQYNFVKYTEVLNVSRFHTKVNNYILSKISSFLLNCEKLKKHLVLQNIELKFKVHYREKKYGVFGVFFANFVS